MNSPHRLPTTPARRVAIRRRARGIVFAGAAALAVAAGLLGWSVPIRAGLIASLCIVLWLGELVPVWIPTIVLWVTTPLLLASFDEAYRPSQVLGWSADPVLALFICGFALAAAASRHGADRAVAAFAIRMAGGSAVRLVACVALATALLSMWISNVAAAALMLAALRPVLDSEPADGSLRRALLLAVALAADVGGIATPVGTGSNGIAMAAVEPLHPISFAQWMVFGVPLALGLVAFALAIIVWRVRPTGELRVRAGDFPAVTGAVWRLVLVFAATVTLWLAEPLHGIRAWIVAIGAVVVLAAARLIGWRDLWRMDWSTLILIAGGIALGTLLDRSGLVYAAAGQVALDSANPTLRLLALCLASAFLSALMSNTATAAFLIPLAMSVEPSPSTAVIVAVAASLGVPFVISTPPNAMAVGGGLPSRDLLAPGLAIMLVGCVLVTLTGPWVLRTVGIP